MKSLAAVTLCALLHLLVASGVQGHRQLLAAPPPPPPGYTTGSGLSGITPVKLAGAKYPADVVTCALLQSATPDDTDSSTAASDGMNELYARGEGQTDSKSPVAGTLAATVGNAVSTPGPDGQNGAPGLVASVQTAVQRGDNYVRPFALAFSYTFTSGGLELIGYFVRTLQALLAREGCDPVVKVIAGAYSVASTDGLGNRYADEIFKTFGSDSAVGGCFAQYGSMTSAEEAIKAFEASGAASS